MSIASRLYTKEELKAAIEKRIEKYKKLWDKWLKANEALEGIGNFVALRGDRCTQAAEAVERAFVRILNIEDEMTDIRHQLNLLQEDYKNAKNERESQWEDIEKEIIDYIRKRQDEKSPDDITKLHLCVMFNLSFKQAAAYIRKYGH